MLTFNFPWVLIFWKVFPSDTFELPQNYPWENMTKKFQVSENYFANRHFQKEEEKKPPCVNTW